MMTCREVSTLVSTGGLQGASLARRLGAVMHLTMCRHCRAFRRHVNAIGAAARALGAAFDAELPSRFETNVVQRLLR